MPLSASQLAELKTQMNSLEVQIAVLQRKVARLNEDKRALVELMMALVAGGSDAPDVDP